MLALEHAFSTIAFMWSCQFAMQQGAKPSQAVTQLRSAALGAVFDSKDHDKTTREQITTHLERMFQHVAKMAEHADKA